MAKLLAGAAILTLALYFLSSGTGLSAFYCGKVPRQAQAVHAKERGPSGRFAIYALRI